MPELPEVQTVVNTLAARLVGQRLVAVTLLREDIVCPRGFDLAGHLAGRAVASILRRGKRIVFVLDDGGRFYIHLGMTGQLTIVADGAAVEKHTHFSVTLGQGTQTLRFRDPRRFGGIFWLDGHAPETLGPEPLNLRPDRLHRLLSGTTRAIKSALLDQRLIAGLGNIYVDESLFLARINPTARANGINAEQARRLNRAIKRVLRRAIRHRGSTLRDYVDGNGDAGAFQLLHNVYDRAGEPCRSCGTGISRIVISGRSTHFCPACQRVRNAKPVDSRRKQRRR